MITKKRIFQINFSRVLQQIRLRRGISRIAIAEELNLDRSTITKVVRTLIELNLVRTTEKYHGKPGVGRMATGLEIHAAFGLVLGIEVQSGFFRCALVDLDGSVVKSWHHPLTSSASIEKGILRLYDSARKTASAQNKKIIGIGIGAAGIIDPFKGDILFSNPLKIGMPLNLRERIEHTTQLPVFVENDANCCCWGELAFRSDIRKYNFITLLGEFRDIDIKDNRIPGIAFGIGFVINDRVLFGDNLKAGEFRSLLYDYDTPSHCQFAISDREASLLPRDGDVLEKVFRDLSYNISLLANTLDIAGIVVTGDFARYGDILTPLLRDEIQKNSLYPGPCGCEIEYSREGENAVCIGAAGLFIKKLFTVPGMGSSEDERLGCILLEKIVPFSVNGADAS